MAEAVEELRAGEPLLTATGFACIAVDRAFVVRATLGAVELLPSLVAGEGQSLWSLLPEAGAAREQLDALLAGSLEALDLSPRRRAGFEQASLLAFRLTPWRSGEAVNGILCTMWQSQAGVRLQQESERQRREFTELERRYKQVSLELTLAQAELGRLDDVKSRFVSAAAHELRNPLAALLGYIELLAEDASSGFTPTHLQYLRSITLSAQRLRQLTNNLLDISRLDSGRLELVMQAMDPLELVELALADVQPLIDAKEQQLVLGAEPSLPAVWCDKGRALQILMNLLSNANKYAPKGGTINAHVSLSGDDLSVTFAIRDNGIGIPADEQTQLFTRFYRAANATAADGAGAGLGLALTQSLVRLHGGKIWFESREGDGSTFFVSLPVAR